MMQVKTTLFVVIWLICRCVQDGPCAQILLPQATQMWWMKNYLA
jgi:hypothetical protein